MARNRCSYEKRAKEIARKQKQEEKTTRLKEALKSWINRYINRPEVRGRPFSVTMLQDVTGADRLLVIECMQELIKDGLAKVELPKS